MANWVLVSQVEAKDMFAEANGAFGIQVNYGGIAAYINDKTQDIHRNQLTQEELRTLGRALHSSIVASLGTFSFVFVYERYKKMCNRYPDRHLDPSAAFGLQAYSDNDGGTLAADYPSTVIHAWHPDVPAKGTWFADVVRNSFAHGQSRVTTQGNRLGVELTNTRDGSTLNYDIFMDLKDFARLIAAALRNFICTVVEGGSYQPLSKLLEWELS